MRRYERWGYLPPAERTASGHRRYGPRHLHAILAVRAMQAGYGWFTGGRIMRRVQRGDVAGAHDGGRVRMGRCGWARRRDW